MCIGGEFRSRAADAGAGGRGGREGTKSASGRGGESGSGWCLQGKAHARPGAGANKERPKAPKAPKARPAWSGLPLAASRPTTTKWKPESPPFSKLKVTFLASHALFPFAPPSSALLLLHRDDSRQIHHTMQFPIFPDIIPNSGKLSVWVFIQPHGLIIDFEVLEYGASRCTLSWSIHFILHRYLVGTSTFPGTFRGWGELRLQISAAIIFSNSAFLAICLMKMT
jgi:hypothetical protein